MPEILRGQLGTIRFASLLQFVEMDQLSGHLALGDDGQVRFSQGQPVHAHFRGLEGVDALLALLPVEAGDFSLADDPVDESEPLCSLMGLIMGGARLQDEWERLAPAVLALAEGAQVQDGDSALAQIVAQLDGEKTLAEAIYGIAHPFKVLDAVIDAMEEGALVMAGMPNPERAAAAMKPPSPDEYYPLLDEARQKRRTGDLKGAEACLRRALLIRPDDRMLQQNIRRIRQLQER